MEGPSLDGSTRIVGLPAYGFSHGLVAAAAVIYCHLAHFGDLQLLSSAVWANPSPTVPCLLQGEDLGLLLPVDGGGALAAAGNTA